MSGENHGLKKGEHLLHKGKKKKVKDWYFTSTPIHNTDEIVIEFTDGTDTGKDGWLYIKRRGAKHEK